MTCPELGRCEETLRPNSTRPCNTHPCTTWVVGSWGEVSGRLLSTGLMRGMGGETNPQNQTGCYWKNTLLRSRAAGCGVALWGMRTGLVPRRADGAALLPQCTAPCGGGIQRRQVKCINTKTGLAEEDSSLCDHEPWPESTQKCNPQDCESAEAGK